MAYDHGRGTVILFGGRRTDPFVGDFEENDTWSFDGEAWTEISIPSNERPSNRTGHVMAYDAGRQRIVLHGGRGVGQDRLDTWEWDGAVWTLMDDPAAAGARPGERSDHEMAYRAGEIILFGGQIGGSTLSNMWRWAGHETP